MSSQQHPLLLQALEKYVRKPLDGTRIDQELFTPVKALYLNHRQHVMGRNKEMLSKAD